MTEEKTKKIVIFVLDSLLSNVVLEKIVNYYKEKIILICNSKRYGGKYGSFLNQVKKQYQRSGLGFIIYLSLNLELYKIFIWLVAIINKILGRPQKIFSLKEIAGRYNIRIVNTAEINSPETVGLLRELQPDLIISFYFDQLIKKEILTIPKYGCVNLHPGILPFYRGPFPVIWELIKGEKKLGATIHFMNEKLDEGPIIHKLPVELESDKSILYLEYKVFKEGTKLIIQTIKEINEGIVRSINQEKGSYYHSPTKTDLKEPRKRGYNLFRVKEFINLFI